MVATTEEEEEEDECDESLEFEVDDEHSWSALLSTEAVPSSFDSLSDKQLYKLG